MANDGGEGAPQLDKVEGEGNGCRGCFARQVAARAEAEANGEAPKPLCVIAARIQAQLNGSLKNSRPLRILDGEQHHDGKMG